MPTDRPHPHSNYFIDFFVRHVNWSSCIYQSQRVLADQGDGTMTCRADHDGTTTRRVDQKVPSLRAFCFGVVL